MIIFTFNYVISKKDRVMKKINDNKNFKVNIKEFIVLCETWLNTFVIGKKGFVPNERLIRGYVSEEILPRPERKGKESIYGYKHLIYFLVCRDLFSENWPLAKIGEHFKAINFEELEINFLKQYNQISVNDSLKVIGELKKSSQNKIKNQKIKQTDDNYTKKGMHGYLPESPNYNGVFVSNKEVIVDEVTLENIMPSILDMFKLHIPKYVKLYSVVLFLYENIQLMENTLIFFQSLHQ